MSVMTDGSPRVRLCIDPGSPDAGDQLSAAARVLAQAHRIRLVGADDQADIVHTVGDPQPMRVRGAARRVHTLDRIPLRDGHVALLPAWARRLRHASHAATAWLTHGQAAGRLLVDAGLVPGERVHCLPLLTPREESAPDNGVARRTQLRGHLGVPLGVRLVVGMETGRRGPARGWERALLAAARSDVAVALAEPADASVDGRYLVAAGGRAPFAVCLRDLLAAADLVVASDPNLLACPPAGAALAHGIPVIAVTTDSVAELVLATGSGFVVQPGAARVARAVLAQIDAGLPPRRPAGVTDPHPAVIDLARNLLAVYRGVLGRPAIGSVA